MLGLPIELITMLGSSLFSGIMTMMSNSSKARNEFMKLALEQKKQESIMQVQQMKVDKGFAFTRRIIALTVVVGVMIMLIAPIFIDVSTVIELKDESSFLFGLFNSETINYEIVKGALHFPEWLKHTMLSIIGLYFGNSMVK